MPRLYPPKLHPIKSPLNDLSSPQSDELTPNQHQARPRHAPQVRLATLADTLPIATLHREAFTRQMDSETWVHATLSAAPRMLAFVLELEGEIAGYIFWAQKSGIRPEATLELDQIAVAGQHRGRGFGEHLIKASLALVTEALSSQGQRIKSVLVSTRADNAAQQLYAKVLGAKVVASIDGLYSATEVIMLATLN